jgi:hypothetical protein
MYYLYGENVIIDVREDPHLGSVGPSTTCFKTHQPVERRMYAMIMREWYRRIKLRRGSKIARVAVMRRITTIFWHMLTYQEGYVIGGPPLRLREQSGESGSAA